MHIKNKHENSPEIQQFCSYNVQGEGKKALKHSQNMMEVDTAAAKVSDCHDRHIENCHCRAYHKHLLK